MIQTDKYIERLSQATSTKSIIGFRQWIIDEGSLRSIGHGNTIWDANHIIADCGRTTHIAPDRFCECGLYAYYYLPEEWIDEIFFEDDLEPDPVVYDSGYINGIVVGAGRTELHSEGFRSERMQIIAILNNFNSESLKVSESYGVPLLSTYDEVFDYLESLENVEMIPYDDEGIFQLPESFCLDKEGKLHSENDKPALVLKDGSSFWAKHGIRHRKKGPAIILDEKEIYYRKGFRHSEFGPAFISPDKKEYYWRGEEISYEKWCGKTKKL